MRTLTTIRGYNRLLAHRDRWRVEEMLNESVVDVRELNPERDFQLFQHLFFAGEPVSIDDRCSNAQEVTPGELVHQVDSSKYVALSAEWLLRRATYVVGVRRVKR